MSAKRQPGIEGSRRVRPAAPGRFFSAIEVAELLDVEEARVVRLLERGLCPQAWEDPPGSGAWWIPAPEVRRMVGGGGSIERLYSVRGFAELVGLSYFTIFRATKDKPGQPAQVRTVTILGERRIPESEYWRLTGRRRPAVA